MEAAAAALAAYRSLKSLMAGYEAAEGRVPVPLDPATFMMLARTNDLSDAKWAYLRCPPVLPPANAHDALTFAPTRTATARVVVAHHPETVAMELADCVLEVLAKYGVQRAITRAPVLMIHLARAAIADRMTLAARRVVAEVICVLDAELSLTGRMPEWIEIVMAMRPYFCPHVAVAICEPLEVRRQLIYELRWVDLDDVVDLANRTLEELSEMGRGVAEFVRRRRARVRRNVAAFVRWRSAATTAAPARRAATAARYAGLRFCF